MTALLISLTKHIHIYLGCELGDALLQVDMGQERFVTDRVTFRRVLPTNQNCHSETNVCEFFASRMCDVGLPRKCNSWYIVAYAAHYISPTNGTPIEMSGYLCVQLSSFTRWSC